MSGDSTTGEQRRRQLLKRIGVASTVGLVAGCSGDGTGTANDGGSDGSTDTSDGSTASSDPEYFSVMMGGTRPDNQNWNPYGKNVLSSRMQNNFYEGLMKYYPESDKWVPQLATGFEWPDEIKQGEKFRINLSEEYTWSDGTQFTAEDVYGQFKIDEVDAASYWNFIEGVEVVDNNTLDLTLSGPVAKEIFLNALFGLKGLKLIKFKRDVYEKYLDAIENAGSDEERKQARDDLRKYEITGSEANELGLGLGPFGKFHKASPSKLILKKKEDYQSPIGSAEDIEYEFMEGLPVDSPQKKVRAMKNKRIDAVTNAAMPKSQLDTIPDQYKSVPKSGHVGGVFVYNCRNSPLDNRKVRYALSTIFSANHDILMQNLPYAPKMKKKVPLSTGLGGPDLNKQWLGDKRGDFLQFDGGVERAAKLLREEGFEKKGGTWHKPSGEKFELTFKGASFHKNRTQTAAQILSEFGIPTSPVVEENGVWFGKTVPNNDYDLTHWWGGQLTSVVYKGLSKMLVDQADLSAYLNGVESPNSWSDGKTSGLVVDLPPVGKPEGERREFDINKTLESLATSQSQSEKEELVQDLAWSVNWMNAFWGPWLLYLPNQFYNTKGWNWPSQDSEAMQLNTVQWWPQRDGGYPKPQ